MLGPAGAARAVGPPRTGHTGEKVRETRRKGEDTTMASTEAMIVAGVRTPMGAMNGGLAAVPAPQLGATCVKAVVARTGVPGELINEVIMGNCIAAGLGMNPARQVAIGGGLPPSVGATTLNRACASGMRAVMLAGQA